MVSVVVWSVVAAVAVVGLPRCGCLRVARLLLRRGLVALVVGAVVVVVWRRRRFLRCLGRRLLLRLGLVVVVVAGVVVVVCAFNGCAKPRLAERTEPRVIILMRLAFIVGRAP